MGVKRAAWHAIGVAGLVVAGVSMSLAQAQHDPGVTDKEITIGQTNPYTGPLSSYSTQGRVQAAFYTMINEQGGVNGRKIKFISLDDGYSPPKTVEQTRRLVEEDQVVAIVGSMGTPTNTAIVRYMNAKKVPHILLATGASKWGNPKDNPWTMGWYPTYKTEGVIYGKYILKNIKDAKIGVLYQNDDYGKDFLNGLKQGLGDQADKLIVKEVTYEVSDPTVDSQVVTLMGAGANVFFSATTNKAAAQAIRKTYDIGWHPTQFLVNNAASIATVLTPAGLDKSIGIISTAYMKDPADPQFADDAGIKWYRGFMQKYYPEGDINDPQNEIGISIAQTAIQILKQCGDQLTRDNIVKQAANLHNLELPLLLPGIALNTAPDQYYPITQQQLIRFDGKSWVRFGDVLSGS
ncbi:MAG: ABC transporter substrate-binding protein [Xanthobacteraceae bacterium]|nr:ABC transporter substrate-binding protein [Xanthobacteraceae bacterium]